MTGPTVAGLLLSLALLALPPSPRRRLIASGRVPVPPVVRRRALPYVAAGALAAVVVLLPVTTVVAAALVGGTVSLRYRRKRRARRARDEGRTLETALDVLVGELRVGAHPVRAFAVAAEETVGAVAASLRAVAARARLGADVTAGLRAAARSSALAAHWDRLAVCWQLASEHGLAIATLMRAAQRDIAERQRFSGRVSASMAGARATATILAALPALGVALGQLVGARPLNFLLSGHLGGWLLAFGSMLACVGLLWSDRITDRATA
jgi:tight adherence protein B